MRQFLFAALACVALSTAGAAPPPVPIEQALKLAQEHLAGRGLAGRHFIGGITLENSTLLGGKQFWFARWVPSIPDEKSAESGLRINMDGSLVRLTTGARSGAPVRPGTGANR